MQQQSEAIGRADSGRPLVCAAAPEQRERVLAVITLAFAADPFVRYWLPDPQVYTRDFPRIAGLFGGAGFERGTALYAQGFAGAALWLPPGVQPQGEAMAELALREMPPDRQEEFAAVGEQMDHHRPSQPHWFLPLMGVDPMRQGSGHGSALLRHALQRCDEEGAIAYLDATSPRNLQLYKRHGFEPQGEIRAGQSPPLIPMLRHPGA